MPIFEYKCRKCGQITEVLEKLGGRTGTGPVSCPKCGGPVERLFSAFRPRVKQTPVQPGCEGCLSSSCPYAGK